ncbi:hypothetical protein B0H17DRAFT_1135109 [Mycena rosella]|uniref:Uncharacterized protein n=1 Tax=Mycena rosella TaxID=1033263 RepID=A0AAD7GIB4_MYCRO|nr:hypothetical protein B0H17DRAFT_1135109 [Mycena rosella]
MDILQTIFLDPDIHDFMVMEKIAPPSIVSVYHPNLVASVSLHWRDVVWGTPKFWTSFNLRLSPHGSQHIIHRLRVPTVPYTVTGVQFTAPYGRPGDRTRNRKLISRGSYGTRKNSKSTALEPIKVPNPCASNAGDTSATSKFKWSRALQSLPADLLICSHNSLEAGARIFGGWLSNELFMCTAPVQGRNKQGEEDMINVADSRLTTLEIGGAAGEVAATIRPAPAHTSHIDPHVGLRSAWNCIQTPTILTGKRLQAAQPTEPTPRNHKGIQRESHATRQRQLRTQLPKQQNRLTWIRFTARTGAVYGRINTASYGTTYGAGRNRTKSRQRVIRDGTGCRMNPYRMPYFMVMVGSPKNAALSIAFEWNPAPQSPRTVEALNGALEHAERWDSVVVPTDPEFFEKLSPARGRLHKLERITFYSKSDSAPSGGAPVPGVFRDVPALRSVAFRNVKELAVLPPFPWRQVQNVHIDHGTVDALCGIMKATPKLQHIQSIHVQYFHWIPSDVFPSHSPFLKAVGYLVAVQLWQHSPKLHYSWNFMLKQISKDRLKISYHNSE